MRAIVVITLILFVFSVSDSFSQPSPIENPFYFANETDHPSSVNFSFFDLRDRESFVQLTNIDSSNVTVHIQIYNVGNLCNENNFFDVYTPNDTHVYNMRDILSNDGNPTGVDLPDDAYGIVFASTLQPGQIVNPDFAPIIGNFRVIDNSGYEYRTNSQSFIVGIFTILIGPNTPAATTTFNFSDIDGIVLSDIVGIPINSAGEFLGNFEADISNPVTTFTAVDVDIINNNETLFSCRDVVFACIGRKQPVAGRGFTGSRR